MDWTAQLGSMLQNYASGRADQQAAEQDFDHLAQHAPRDTVASGIAEAFRSDQTAPFPNMLSQLFTRSAGDQRATVLNTLVSTLGPACDLACAEQARRRDGQFHRAGCCSAPGSRSGAGGGGAGNSSQAERTDPSVMDRISHFYADQPAIVKTLGGLALAVAMAKVAQGQTKR